MVKLVGVGTVRKLECDGETTLKELLEDNDIAFDAGMTYRAATKQLSADSVVGSGAVVLQSQPVSNG